MNAPLHDRHPSKRPSGRLFLSLGACLVLIACERPRPAESTPAPAPAPESTGPATGSEPPPEGPTGEETRVRTVYVPAYSHLPKGHAKRPPVLFSILLSVRNMDTAAVVTLTHVDYFDTSGHRVRRYLDKPRALRPLETVEFAVDTLDEAGGSGANFLVYWEGPSDAHPLLTETVMVGQVESGHVGFTSRGVELDRRPEPGTFEGPKAPAANP